MANKLLPQNAATRQRFRRLAWVLIFHTVGVLLIYSPGSWPLTAANLLERCCRYVSLSEQIEYDRQALAMIGGDGHGEVEKMRL
jgi:hypothetical protein